MQTVFRHLVAGLVVALCVQLALLPLTIEHFHRVAPAGLAATLAVEAVLGVALVAGLSMLVLSGPVPWAASMLVPLVRATAEWGIEIARVSPTSLSVGAHEGPASVAPAMLVASLVVTAIAVSRWRPVPRDFSEHVRPRPSIGRRLVAALVIAATLGSAALSLFPPERRQGDGRLHVTMLDVGQGDCALVVFPRGTTMLVDAGGRPRFAEPLGYEDGRALFAERFDIGERIVCRALWSLGVSRLDLIAATHGDADHVGGFDAVIRHFPVGAAILPAGRDGHIEPFRAAVERADIPIRDLGEGSELEIEGVRVEVLWPRSGGARGNNASLVMRLVYGSRAIELTGDVEREGERELVRDAAARGANLNADVLKVAHHGSRSSTTGEFLASVRPSLAVISAPRLSPYGHPHPDVVERLKRSGIRVLQTGRAGAVECVTDGSSWSVRAVATQPPGSSSRLSGTRNIGSEEVP